MACTPKPPAAWDELEALVTPYPENEFIRSTIFSAMAKGVGLVMEPGGMNGLISVRISFQLIAIQTYW